MNRIDTLVADVAQLKEEMKRNTEVTTQVRDILTSFRIVGMFAKWTAGIGAAAAAIYSGIDFIRR